MVVFTCTACGESLKKSQVEKHYQYKCRQCTVLTCVDCLKDFPDDSYKSHNQCISEQERYSAKGWQPKASFNKGAQKQQAWLNGVRALVETQSASLDPDVKHLLISIADKDNIPRKRQKFINFVKNATGKHVAPATVEKAWEVFEKSLKAPPSTAEAEQAELSESGQGKKRKGSWQEEAGDNNSEQEVSEKKRKKTGKFDWEAAIERLLETKGQMKVSRLKKKVINEYLAAHEGGASKTQVQLEAKLEKKLSTNKKFKYVKDHVSLATARC